MIRARELQTSPAEGQLGGREHGYFRFRLQAQNALDRFGKAFEDGCLVRTTDQMSGDVAAVAVVHRAHFIVALVEFVELPLGRAGVQMGQSFAGEGRASGRQE